jgi:acetylglutamate kinase
MKTTVVKLGGSLLENADSRAQVLGGIAARWFDGERIVLVHGGGKRIDADLKVHGIPRNICGGLRVTDTKTLEVVVGALAGYVNKLLVSELSMLGVTASGLSGADGGTLKAEFHPPVDGVDLGFVGRPVAADTSLINAILGIEMMPVVATVAKGPGKAMLNVNADAAAATIASALGSSRLVFLTDVDGVLDKDKKTIERITAFEAGEMLGNGVVTGGMRPKLQACLAALSHGSMEVVIAGPAAHRKVLNGKKGGTRLVA